MSKSSMPPALPKFVPGTLTSDRYGNVVSTRPAPKLEPVKSASTAPTSDRWGHVISTPPGAVKESTVLPPGAVGREATDGKIDWK